MGAFREVWNTRGSPGACVLPGTTGNALARIARLAMCVCDAEVQTTGDLCAERGQRSLSQLGAEMKPSGDDDRLLTVVAIAGLVQLSFRC